MLHDGNSRLIKLQAFLAEYYELLTAAKGSYKALPGRSVGLDIKCSPLFFRHIPFFG